MKMRSGWLGGVVLLGLVWLSGWAPARSAPDGIESGEWINLIGEAPTLDTLQGRPVLLHFFGPPQNQRGGGSDDGGGLPGAYFSLIRKFHHDYDSKGLVILGFCDESRSKVQGYLDAYDVPYPVAIGGSARRTFAVEGPCHLILLDRDGEVFWRGPTNGLWNGKLNKGAKGAKRLGERGRLALHLNRPLSKRVEKAADQCADGDLAKALKTLETLIANARTTPEEKGEAESVKTAIGEHVTMLMEQIEECFASGETLLAMDALELLAKELKKHELGAAPRKRLEEIEADDAMQKEIEAAKEYHSVLVSYFKRGLRANLPRLERIIADHPKTKAAQKARNLMQGR